MTAQTILPANSAASGGYEVANSLRFAGAARDTYLTATFGSAPTLATKNTISLWFKRSLIDTNQQLYTTNSNAANIIFNRSGASTGPTAAFYTNSGQLLGPRLYRDSSAWMHFVYTFDSTQGTEANRTKVYINGVQETSFNNTAYPAQEASQLGVNGEEIQIGTRSNYDRIFDGYMAETAFVDGQALAADSFGEFDSDSGIWKPIDISGLTFGNNGFYLEYKQTGTSANSSGIGADTSGNDLHFAVNAFTAADQSTDTCTNNFATLNPLIYGSNYTWSEGNLQFTQAATNWDTTYSSIGVTKGKWYMEFKGKVGAYYDVGVTDVIDPTNNLSVNTGGVAWKSNSEFAQGGNVGGGLPSNVTSPASNTYTADDIIGIALDVDNETVYFAKNGTYEVNSDPTSGASKTGGTDLPNSGSTYFFAFAAYKGGSASGTAQVNFGGGSVDAISSGNTDADGHGNFEHAPPSGYFALCTKNLAEYGG